MAKLRKGCAYRRIERPYTRISKFKDKSFIRANPNVLIVRFEMGDKKKRFSHAIELKSKEAIQIRHNSLESARQSSNRMFEKKIGKENYFMKIMVYPHHILRENPLAAGAGADRMSTGMKMSFGKAIGVSAQVRKGQKIMVARVNKDNLETAKRALKSASYKLPCSCSIVVAENK